MDLELMAATQGLGSWHICLSQMGKKVAEIPLHKWGHLSNQKGKKAATLTVLDA